MIFWLVLKLEISYNRVYNFALNLKSIKGLHTTLWASKVTRVSILGILGIPFESPETK
jgi:hypothetical protein